MDHQGGRIDWLQFDAVVDATRTSESSQHEALWHACEALGREVPVQRVPAALDSVLAGTKGRSERLAVPAAAVHKVRADLDLAQVAGIGVAGGTAWEAVHNKAHVGPHDRVLVLGASGGVGSMAVQLAKACGATVWGQTTNKAKVDGIAVSTGRWWSTPATKRSPIWLSRYGRAGS